jgi:hypothetical protein
MTSSFSLTNGKAYIRFKVWNLVQIQPIRNEEFAAASDAVSWREDASLVQVVSGLFFGTFKVDGRVRRPVNSIALLCHFDSANAILSYVASVSCNSKKQTLIS